MWTPPASGEAENSVSDPNTVAILTEYTALLSLLSSFLLPKVVY